MNYFTALTAGPIVAGLAIALVAPVGTVRNQRSGQQSPPNAAISSTQRDPQTSFGSCGMGIPATVRVGKKVTNIAVRVTEECARKEGVRAIWYRGRPDLSTAYDVVIFDNAKTSTWKVPSTGPLGLRTWRGWAAFDGDRDMYNQDEPITTVKVVSYAGLRATRAKGKTTLNTRVVRYAITLDKSIPYRGETGVIQYRVPGEVRWNGLKNVVADSQGLYTYSYTTSDVREYRVVYQEAKYIWGSTSPTRIR